MYNQALQERFVPFPLLPILSILLLIFLFNPTEAKVGYDIHVVVNNSTMSSEWGRSQSTNVMSFQADSICSGDGKFAKYVNVEGFAGQSLKETGYSNPGRLIYNSTLQVKSDVCWINIAKSGETSEKNYTNDFNTTTINATDIYTVEINESLPTFVLSREDLYYNGEGIRTRSAYVNNEDEIYTRYYATRLLKSSRYGGIHSSSIINVSVTPARVEESVLTNSTTAFRISSQSDRYSGLAYVSEGEEIEQSYFGSFTINQVITSKKKFSLENQEDWLSCCPSKSDIDEAWSSDLNCTPQEVLFGLYVDPEITTES